MKLNRLQSSFRKGFTLLELLVVMAIIAILAGLTLGGFKYAQHSAAMNRTAAGFAMIKSGLEQYKEKNGEYPEPANKDEPITVGGVSIKSGPARMLYQAITGDGDSAIMLASAGSNDSDGKVSQEEMEYSLNGNLPKTLIGGSRGADGSLLENGYLVDGWFRPFQYEKGGTLKDGSASNALNPTYDLWSFGGLQNGGGLVYEPEGRRNAETTASWVKNW